MQLFREVEKIRDGLLQESFTMRRSLELLTADNIELSKIKSQDYLKTIEKFHYSLEQLSDRLSPAYIEDSLPLAIQCVIESWQMCNPKLKIEMDLPAHWQHEPLERSMIIVRTIDELLKITSSELLPEISIYVSLKSQKNICKLSVHISYPTSSKLIYYYSLKDLEYLSKTFQFLTSGKCFRQKRNMTVIWYFEWVTQKDRPQG